MEGLGRNWLFVGRCGPTVIFSEALTFHPMRVLVSDYSGHPFQVQLSRSLARRGHEVLHVTAESFQTPKGKLARDPNDPASFNCVGVRTRGAFAKTTFVKRRSQEIEIGRLIAGEIARFEPEMVISSNAPLDAQRHIQQAARRAGAGFVFWVQDLYGEAIQRILAAKLGLLGQAIGKFYNGMEARLLRRSDHIVAIAEDFRPVIEAMTNLPPERVSVIENWAPLDEIPSCPRDNDWACEHLPNSPFRIVYSGTLGFKHNPGLLAAVARAKIGEVIVFSEGAAADRLRELACEEGLSNLDVRGWLEFESLPAALGGADLLVVILEPDAAIFSVPSKVLTYMCVGRPILGALPAANLAARLVADNAAGLVSDPADELGFVEAARRIASNREEAARMGRAARAYAEHAFDIETITDRFEEILNYVREEGLVHG